MTSDESRDSSARKYRYSIVEAHYKPGINRDCDLVGGTTLV